MKRKIAVATMALIPLTATSAFAGSKEGIVTATSLNVRSGPSTSDSVLFSLKKNEKVSILDSSNGWYKISSSNGKVGWASGEYINTNVTEEGTDDNKKVVTADVLNMRSGASTSYRVILKLNKGDIVDVISESNGWSKIKYDGRIGYVSSEYLGNLQTGNPGVTPEPEPETTIIKIVNATSLNIRSGPSTSHGIVGKLNKGEKVEVISESNGWSKIKFNGSIAYTSSQYLSNNNGVTPTPDPEPETTTIKTVNATSLNVRSGPSTSHGIVGKLNKGEKVEVISESNGWSKIKFNGIIAYTSSQYLSNNNGGNPTPNPEPETIVKTVNTTSLNVRSGPSTSHGIVGKLNKGEKVEVISESNGWSKIKFNGSTAYTSSQYLSSNTGGTTDPDDTIDGGDRTEIVNGATVQYKSVSYTFTQHVDKQYAKGNGNVIDRGFVTATKSELMHYMNPINFVNSKKGMLQFLRLDSYKGGITASELNGYLNSLRADSNGTNVFYNKGQVFIDAAKKHNIDLVYLVGHSMVESAYGRSTLAKGQVLTSYKGNPLPEPVTVYNFFGIGAYDGSANLSGAEAAYHNGWTTIEKTIDGSAKWIANNYIHSSKYNQNTLYKMRYSYEHLNHQYATDVNWCNVISGVMNNLIGMYDTASNLIFEVPIHKK